MRNREIREAARRDGVLHFIAICPRHGESRHYTSSGRCIRCAAGAKDPEKQAAYWATVKDEINQKKRSAYASDKKV